MCNRRSTSYWSVFILCLIYSRFAQPGSNLAFHWQMYMSEMIKERRESQGVERHDLFSSLLASCDAEGEDTFTEKDLMGISI